MSQRSRAALEQLARERARAAKERREAVERRAVAAGWASLEHVRLAAAVDRMSASGERPVCRGLDAPAWTSENVDDRAVAALYCLDGCPALAVCDAAGAVEAFGVWGGVDRTEERLLSVQLDRGGHRQRGAAA